MCVRMFLVCIFSSKIIATEEIRLFFFAFSEGVNKRKKVTFPQKHHTRDSTYLFSIHAHKTHTHTQRTAAFAAFEENLREF